MHGCDRQWNLKNRYKIVNDKLEQVSNFQYLGIWINETMKHDVDVRANVAKSKQAFWKHKELRNNIRLKTKLRLLKTQVWSVLRYGSKCFALTKSLQKKITAFEFWCYRRILKISWNDYVSNEEVLLKIKIEKPELLQSVIKRKIRYLGHILRESAGKDLKKMTMIVNEKKGRGKRRTNWTSIVFENMKIKDMRTAELKANDKEKWKKIEDGT